MHWVLYYLLFQVFVFLFFWIFSKRKDKRYKMNNGILSEGFEPTEEVSIDPVSHVKIRVFVDPKTGERLYIEEDR
jgi:uncharacterized protein YraI